VITAKIGGNQASNDFWGDKIVVRSGRP